MNLIQLFYLTLNVFKMKHISILVPENAVVQAVADPEYCFNTVNHFLAEAGKEPLFEIELVGFKEIIKMNQGRFSVHPDKQLNEIEETDLIIIPAISGDMQECIDLNKDFIPWIQQQHASGAEVASLCVGAFLLAATGLLNGSKCSTHWGFSTVFNQMFPEVDMQDGTIVTEEKRIYSSGGATSYWNLLLHLVEKYTDRATAIWISKYFAIDIDRQSQSAFAMFTGQKKHQDEAIKEAQEYIEQNIDEKITVETLADKVAVGRRTFERRFKQATNNSVLAYIQRVKIESAKRQFECSRKNITEVMFDVGYTDTKAFRTIFKKITGLTPVEYRNKYNKRAMA